jgi:hypothetical protein
LSLRCRIRPFGILNMQSNMMASTILYISGLQRKFLVGSAPALSVSICVEYKQPFTLSFNNDGRLRAQLSLIYHCCKHRAHVFTYFTTVPIVRRWPFFDDCTSFPTPFMLKHLLVSPLLRRYLKLRQNTRQQAERRKYHPESLLL